MNTTNWLKAVMAGLVLLVAGMARADVPGDLPYDSLSTGTDGALKFSGFLKPGRYGHSAAYDAERKQVVVFGGLGYSGGYLSDTWIWDGQDWRQVAPPTAPPARLDACMAYDRVRRKVVLFGGTDATGVPRSDSWEWDGLTWTQLTPATTPPARSDSAMVFDETRGELLMFGGYNNVSGYLSDTWKMGADGDWHLITPPLSPSGRSQHAMAWLSSGVVVLHGGANGYDETWHWNGTTWTKKSTPLGSPSFYNHTLTKSPATGGVLAYGGYNPSVGTVNELWHWDGSVWKKLDIQGSSPAARTAAAMAFDEERGIAVMIGGSSGTQTETFAFDQINLASMSARSRLVSADYAVLDMAVKPDGVWNYTTVDVPAGLTLYFKPNAANTPVRWLASGNVTISGWVNVDGKTGVYDATPGSEAKGGPGGYPGGLGGLRADQSGSLSGSGGQGPGGGDPGVGLPNDQYNNGIGSGKTGTHTGTYGNAYLQPLTGGSGGGGGGSSQTGNGGGGGGGGGAILIASTGDIEVTGKISANGGYPVGYGGYGSGGAIRLVADRVSGNGRLEAQGYNGDSSHGRIRVEGFYRTLVGNSTPTTVVSAPTAERLIDANARLNVIRVAGQNVALAPTGDLTRPDVIFNAPGAVVVTVQGVNVPVNSPVKLRVTTSASVINKPGAGEPPVLLGADGTATFNVTVPAGVGTVQAFTEFTR